jgi:rubredoxin
MTFQFLCPQGHLLQGDPAHMGMQCQCPHCGMTFLIPTVAIEPAAAEPAFPDFGGSEAGGRRTGVYDFLGNLHQQPATAPRSEPEAIQVPGLTAPVVQTEAEAAPRVLHIPCPNGHELETPWDMIGQEVLCPHCGAQFRLRAQDSLESLEAQRRRDAQRGKAWFQWAVAAAVAVGIGVLVLIAVSMSGR